MSKVTMIENSTDRCLLNLPYEIIFEIFRRLSKDELIKISKLSPKFRDTAKDTRFWKDVYIKYGPKEIFAFEELYSEPWPVQTIDLSNVMIKCPVFLDTDQQVKVTELNLASIKANTVTTEAILAKYQCTTLRLDFELADDQGHVMGIAPAAFAKQTALEALSLGIKRHKFDHVETDDMILPYFHHWLKHVLSYYCKNLKILDLTFMRANFDLLEFVKILPASLEKLWLPASKTCSQKSFSKLLAESCPNLRELELCASSVRSPSILEFQFLETLYIYPLCCPFLFRDSLYVYLLKFPALKTVYIDDRFQCFPETSVEMLRSKLKHRCIFVEKTNVYRWPTHPADGNLWKVTKAV